VNPEYRSADQQVAKRPAADARDDREEDEGDERLPLFGGDQGAGNREHRHSEDVEDDQCVGKVRDERGRHGSAMRGVGSRRNV
jgi:hypothetical protein